MDFSVDVKQQELIALAKTIAEKEIAPRALRIDKAESWMKSCWRF